MLELRRSHAVDPECTGFASSWIDVAPSSTPLHPARGSASNSGTSGDVWVGFSMEGRLGEHGQRLRAGGSPRIE